MEQDFFEDVTLEHLIERQGVKPIDDPLSLHCEAFADVDVDEFLKAIRRT